MGKRLTNKEFIEKAIITHGNKYNYSKVNYINNRVKINIICSTHGEFEQIPKDHLKGNGCRFCAGVGLLDTNKFIIMSIERHNRKYSYSNVDYINSSSKVKIICPIHDEFEQTPNNHLKGYGCNKCANNIKYTTKKFIERAIRIHKNTYDYSSVNYINAHTKIIIKCPIHGNFTQTPNNHLNGVNCPTCKESKGERKIRLWLEENDLKYIEQYIFKDCRDIQPLPFDFYLPKYNICIEYQGIQHYKSIKYFGGVSSFKKRQKRDEIKRRYCKMKNINLIELKYNKDVILILKNYFNFL